MDVSSEDLLNRILNAPVGNVITILEDLLDCGVKLDVIEQNSVSPNQFVRKISITVQEMPVIKATVNFDSTVLPEFIMVELLKKKDGIGDILNANNVDATRNVISLNHNPGESKASREYEIVHDRSVWFSIYEEIRLENIGSNDNR